MKRSEMISSLKQKILNELPGSNDVMITLLSEDILEHLENKGMLPPTTVVEIGDGIYQDNCWDKEEE